MKHENNIQGLEGVLNARKSNVIDLNAQFSYNKKQILFLTKIDEDAYDSFVQTTGLDWLEQFVKYVDVRELSVNPYFWAWWKYQWNMDDTKFIDLLYETKEGKLWYYRTLHQYCFDDKQKPAKNLMDDFISFLDDFLKVQNEKK